MESEKFNTKDLQISDKTHKLHKSKRSGLKSVFAIDDKIVVTTFGKKEEGHVVLESDAKRTDGLFSKSQTFEEIKVEKKEVKFISPNKDEFLSTSPFEARKQTIGQDYLGIKDKLEMIFWGKTYPNDNIHIQIAYNLLDIKKIIGLKVGNTIFALNNLQRGMLDVDGETVDYIGQIKFDKNYDDFDERKVKNLRNILNKLIQNDSDNHGKFILRKYIDNLSYYQQYFEGAFRKPEKEKGKDGRPHDNSLKIEEYYKDGFNALQIISFFRQETIHNNTGITGLFNPKISDELKKYVSDSFDQRIQKFKTNFELNNKKVLYFLCKFYDVPMNDKHAVNKLAERYFEYVLWRDDKNLGVNLKKLKELVFESVLEEKDKDNPSELSKINALLNFYIYDYFANKETTLTDTIVSKLRECGGDEKEKENIYHQVSQEFIKKHIEAINKAQKLNDEFNDFNVKNKDHKNDKEKEVEFSISINRFDNIPLFHKMLYALTNYLDEKDSNDVLTSLINKFENIISLIKVASANRYDVWDDFSSETKENDKQKQKGFIDFDAISKQLGFCDDNLLNNDLNKAVLYFRLVKNLATMKNKLKKASIIETGKVNERLFEDAINMLLPDKFLQTQKGEDKKYIDSRFEQYMELFKTKGSGTKTRNVLINNIIKNRRFAYIVKYFDPKKCHKIIEQENIVRFLLSRDDMQDSIIFRYYKLITEDKNAFSKTRKQCIDVLVEQLKKVNIEFNQQNGHLIVTDLFNGDIKNKELISLYLTLVYIFVKGMVRTNSVFALALSALERDSSFYKDDDKNFDKYLGLVHKFKDGLHFKYKNKKYIEENEKELLEIFQTKERIGYAFKFHRDRIAHLNYCFEFANYLNDKMIVKSYYDVYAYVSERMIIDYFKKYNFEIIMPNGEKLETLLDKFNNHNIDFFKLINLPFAYNMARYKNLTISDLFNDKYPINNKEKYQN